MSYIHQGLVVPLTICLLTIGCNEQPTAPDAQSKIVSGVPSSTLAKHDGGSGQIIEFADAEAFFEFNTTDNDLGLQIFLDAEGWNGIRINDANNERIVEVKAEGPLADLGITELRFESAEPSRR